jgi:hypothetical protein
MKAGTSISGMTGLSYKSISFQSRFAGQAGRVWNWCRPDYPLLKEKLFVFHP